MDLIQSAQLFRRFWWLFLILIIIFIPIIFFSFNYLTGGALRIKAQFTPSTKSGFYVNPPTIVNDFLYIGTSINSSYEPEKDNYFYKLNLNLKKIWNYKLPEYHEVQGGAALDSFGNIYFVVTKRHKTKFSSQESDLYSLTNDGHFRWKQRISYNNEIFESGPITPAIGVDDTIYISHGKMYAFMSDGTEKWSYPGDGQVFLGLRSSPIIDNFGNIYFTSPEPGDGIQEKTTIKTYKFSANGNGVPIWETELINNDVVLIEGDTNRKIGVLPSSPAFSKSQNKLYAAIGNTINAVDTVTGILLWSYKPDNISGSFEASPAVDDEDNVYIGTKANEKSTLYAIAADGSGLLWKNHIGGDLYCSPTLGDNGILYIGSEYTSNTGTFHAIDLKTGKYIWNINIAYGLKDFQKTSPAIHKGHAYIGSMHRNIFGPLLKIKIDSEGYLYGAGWPRFHGGNANNGRIN